jgi:phosphate:Na+ symporter
VSLNAFFQLIGGLGLLIYGIKLMSDSLQAIAGDRMRQLIGSLTNTPWRGVVVGAAVTALIQSSSATTVMTVSFVNAGLMQLKQAIGIIMGANIGTTINAQIIAFKFKDFALPVLAFGVALS